MAIQKNEASSYLHADDAASSAPLMQAHTTIAKSSHAVAATTTKRWRARDYWRTAGQIGVLLCIFMYAFGQVMYLSPLIQEDFVAWVSPWLGTTVSRDPNGVMQFDGGHWEMLRPMFFVVWGVPPLLASLVLFELTRDRGASSRRAVSRFVMRIAAFMRRKPRLFGSGSISPFGYGELLFQLFLVGGNVALFWYGWVYERQYLPLAGDPYTFDTVLEISGIIFGYNCVFNMAFLLLPSTRNCAWMDFLGISYTNGVKYHRWLGVLTLVTGVAHAVPFYWWWGRQGTLWTNSVPCFDCALDYLSPGYPVWFNVFGELSLFFLLLVGVTSIPVVRRKLFETFYYTHHLYILGVIFAVMHWVTIIWWLLPSLVLYLISRSVSTWNALQPVQVVEFTALPDDILKIVLARSTAADGGFQIGQFVYLNVPAISKLQWHAFTISSAPSSSATTFTILLKSLGDWTQDLVALAEASRSAGEDDTSSSTSTAMPTMLVDGYYGSSLECYEEFSTVCLIGGGIGVTPLFAILEDIVAKLTQRGQSRVLEQHVHFVFSFRELSLLEEIHPVLSKLRELDPLARSFSARFFLTRTPSESALNQRIDYNRFLNASMQQREAQQLDGDDTWLSPQPFAEPLRSQTARIAVYTVMLVSSSLIVLWLEFGGGRLMQSGTQWWPLENFVEITTLFVLPLLVFAALAIEKLRKTRQASAATHKLLGGRSSAGVQSYNSITTNDDDDSTKLCQQQQPWYAGANTDVLTLGDLISEYDVVVGERPDMAQILTQVHHEFLSRSPKEGRQHSKRCLDDKIGVFISGPEALKSATEHVVADLGSHYFDIHEEEFEL